VTVEFDSISIRTGASMTTTATETSSQSTTSKPFAVITGASSGIGLELAKQFAEHGYDLLIAADESLATAASELDTLGAGVQSVRVDLATSDGVQELGDAVRDAARPVDALCLNAGVGESGPFLRTKLEDDLRLISTNIVSAVSLAKRLVPAMVSRGAGRILVTSSIASIAPAPNQALYGASKSFLQSFAEALRQELKDTGVTVTSLMPGPTETNFFSRAALEHTALGAMKKDDAATVARQGFEALMAGREKVVAGSVFTKVQGQVAKAMPDSAKAAMQGLLSAPGTARKLPGFLKK
jgi:short-subunit dehydrogenase